MPEVLPKPEETCDPKASGDAPNVVIVLLDDVGFGAAGWRTGVLSITTIGWAMNAILSQARTHSPAGQVKVKLVFDYDGGGLGKGGTARMAVNGRFVTEGRIDKTTAEPISSPTSRAELKPALDAKLKQGAAEGELVGAHRAQEQRTLRVVDVPGNTLTKTVRRTPRIGVLSA